MELKYELCRPGAHGLSRPWHPGDVGYDMHVVGDHTLEPGEGKDLPTGVKIEMPEGMWARIVGRSSTRRKRGLSVTEGIIDGGYRGELFSYVVNETQDVVRIAHGDRLTQLILHEAVVIPTQVVDSVTPSARGDNGFGSTGKGKDPKPSLYLGGPIDYSIDGHSWRHLQMWDDFDVYCPVCEADGKLDIHILHDNGRAIESCDWAVFRLDQGMTVGTPVEIEQRMSKTVTGTIIVTGQVAPGLFVRHWASMGATVVVDIDAARSLMGAATIPLLA